MAAEIIAAWGIDAVAIPHGQRDVLREGDHATVRSKIKTRRRAEIGVDDRLSRSTGGWVAVDVVLENVTNA